MFRAVLKMLFELTKQHAVPKQEVQWRKPLYTQRVPLSPDSKQKTRQDVETARLMAAAAMHAALQMSVLGRSHI